LFSAVLLTQRGNLTGGGPYGRQFRVRGGGESTRVPAFYANFCDKCADAVDADADDDDDDDNDVDDDDDDDGADCSVASTDADDGSDGRAVAVRLRACANSWRALTTTSTTSTTTRKTRTTTTTATTKTTTTADIMRVCNRYVDAAAIAAIKRVADAVCGDLVLLDAGVGS
jgi:hypothetical protein